MSLFNKTKELLDEIDYACYMEVETGEWSLFEEDEVAWVNGEDVYSSEITEGVYSQDDCVFVNTDNGCGDTITKVFHKDNRIIWEGFEEKYEEFL